MKTFKGKAWVFGDNLDVDFEIVPFTLIKGIPRDAPDFLEQIGKHCMTLVDPDFPKKVKKGDFIVGGRNMGCGHDHVTGPQAIKGAGVAAVIADGNVNSNFYRNCFHLGMPVVQVRGIKQKVSQGDELELDLAGGKIKNLTTRETVKFSSIPDFLLEIVEAGGLYLYMEKKVRKAARKT